jgi:hypothetical protein
LLGHRLHLVGLLFVIAFGGLLAVDFFPTEAEVTARDVPMETGDEAPPGRARLFALLVDSLSYESASDPKLMPNLARLRERASYARVRTTRDAVTVPAVRAAFTGKERVKLFGFAYNFLDTSQKERSVFGDLKARGGRAAVYSDGAFSQFRSDIAEVGANQEPTGMEIEAQTEALKRAVRDYLTGDRDLVVFHVTYTDHVAHKGGTRHPIYHAAYEFIDETIGRLDETLPESDGFAVFGDHGHDAAGRHMTGLDVPTFAAFRGARYARGLDLGTISIVDYRYLVGWGLGLPLPGSYAGGRHPAALLPAETIPASYREARPSSSPAGASGGALHARARAAPFLALLYVAVLSAVWLAMWREGTALGARQRALSWATVVPLAFPFWLPYSAAVGIAAGVAWLVAIRSASKASSPRIMAGAVASVVLLSAWGSFLFATRPLVHETSGKVVMIAMAVAWTAAVAVALLRRSETAGWGLLAVALFLFYPTVYNYGAMPAMTPAWAGWLFVMLALAAHRRLRAHAEARRAELARTVFLALGAVSVVLFLQPFLTVSTENFKFLNWLTWPASLVPGGLRTMGILGACVVFFRPGMSWPAAAVALVTVALFTVIHLGFIPRGPWEIGIAAFYLAGAVAARRRERPPTDDWVRIGWLGGLFFCYHAFIHVSRPTYAWGECLFAALLLSRWLVAKIVPEREQPAARMFLCLMALVAAGWVTLGWTVHRLEWQFLYGWFDAVTVERRVALFLPLILVRYAIPLWIARYLLRDDPRVPDDRATSRMMLIGGMKVLSLLAITYGMAFQSLESDVSLEAAQETGIFTVLMLGLV